MKWVKIKTLHEGYVWLNLEAVQVIEVKIVERKDISAINQSYDVRISVFQNEDSSSYYWIGLKEWERIEGMLQ